MDPTIPPNLLRDIKNLQDELDLLKRTPRWRATSLHHIPLGTDQGDGYRSTDVAGTYTSVGLSENTMSAPVLQYSITTSNEYETTAVTGISWRMTATAYAFGDPDTALVSRTVAEGESTSASWTAGVETFSGEVDLTSPSLLGVAALFKLLRVEIELYRTGGSGAVALKLDRPLTLKLPDSPSVSIPPPADTAVDDDEGGEGEDPGGEGSGGTEPPTVIYYEGVVLGDTSETWS